MDHYYFVQARQQLFTILDFCLTNQSCFLQTYIAHSAASQEKQKKTIYNKKINTVYLLLVKE